MIYFERRVSNDQQHRKIYQTHWIFENFWMTLLKNNLKIVERHTFMLFSNIKHVKQVYWVFTEQNNSTYLWFHPCIVVKLNIGISLYSKIGKYIYHPMKIFHYLSICLFLSIFVTISIAIFFFYLSLHPLAISNFQLSTILSIYFFHLKFY